MSNLTIAVDRVEEPVSAEGLAILTWIEQNGMAAWAMVHPDLPEPYRAVIRMAMAALGIPQEPAEYLGDAAEYLLFGC